MSEVEQQWDAEAERILSMTDEEVSEMLAAEGFTDKDVEIFHWKALAKATDKLNRLTLSALRCEDCPSEWSAVQIAEVRMERINKLTWQVRDTCVRAEKAEATIATQSAQIEGLLSALKEAWPYVPEHHGPVNHKIRAAIASVEGKTNECS